MFSRSIIFLIIVIIADYYIYNGFVDGMSYIKNLYSLAYNYVEEILNDFENEVGIKWDYLISFLCETSDSITNETSNIIDKVNKKWNVLVSNARGSSDFISEGISKIMNDIDNTVNSFPNFNIF